MLQAFWGHWNQGDESSAWCHVSGVDSAECCEEAPGLTVSPHASDVCKLVSFV